MEGSKRSVKKDELTSLVEQLQLDNFRLTLERDAYKESFESKKEDLEQSQKTIEQLQKRLNDVNLQLHLALEQLQKGKAERFGRKSETAESLQLQWLFDEAEVTFSATETEEEEEESVCVAPHVRKKHAKHKLTTLESSTALIEIDHTEDCPVPVDPVTGKAMVLCGTHSEDKVGFLPAKSYIERHLFPVYAPKEAYEAEDGTNNRIISYPLYSRVLKGVMVTDSLASEVIVKKFTDHLPLYRQEDIFRRKGLAISRQSMASWIVNAAKALEPLGKLLHKNVLQRQLVNMDESPLTVLHEKERSSDSQSYMVVQVGSGGGPTVVYYFYDPYRNATVISSLLSGFSSVLQTDGLSSYVTAVENLTQNGHSCTHIGCWSHARRSFTTLGKGAISKENARFVKMIAKLYKIERDMRQKYSEGFYASESAFVEERVSKVEPVLTAIYKLAQEKIAVAIVGSEFYKAVKYLLNQWPRLKYYPYYFNATPDNNIAERFTRPFAIGSRSWLFANTAAGAKASALMYTLIENAKLNKLNVHDYIWAVLDQAPYCRSEEDYNDLLPWNIDLSDIRDKKQLISKAQPVKGRTEDYIIRGGLY